MVCDFDVDLSNSLLQKQILTLNTMQMQFLVEWMTDDSVLNLILYLKYCWNSPPLPTSSMPPAGVEPA